MNTAVMFSSTTYGGSFLSCQFCVSFLSVTCQFGHVIMIIIELLSLQRALQKVGLFLLSKARASTGWSHTNLLGGAWLLLLRFVWGLNTTRSCQGWEAVV